MEVLNLTELGLIPLFRHPKRRKGSYDHKDQIEFYSNVERGDSDASGEEDTEENSKQSEHFCKRHKFQPQTVEALSLLLGNSLEP